jgi:hypothetical protein
VARAIVVVKVARTATEAEAEATLSLVEVGMEVPRVREAVMGVVMTAGTMEVKDSMEVPGVAVEVGMEAETVGEVESPQEMVNGKVRCTGRMSNFA